jgi:hypothetical protein
VNPNGIAGKFVNDEWIYEPYKLAIRQVNGGALYTICRNIKPGQQPAHLFVIPRDYKWVDTSAAKSEIEKTTEMLKLLQGAKSGNSTGNTEQQQKMQDAMKKVQDALGGKK